MSLLRLCSRRHQRNDDKREGKPGGVAHTIIERLPRGEAALIEHDWYYRDHLELSFEQQSRQNFDEPDALENDLLVAHLIIPEGGENRAALDVIVGCLLYGLR